MEHQLAHLTEEQQPLLRTVVRRGVATAWARLAGLICIHLSAIAPGRKRFVREIARQSPKVHCDACRFARRCFTLAFLPRLRLVRSRMWVRSSKPMRLCG